MNLLSLVTPWLDNICQTKNESVTVAEHQKFYEPNKA